MTRHPSSKNRSPGASAGAGVDDLPAGAIIPERISVGRETGGWRVQRPVVDMARCTHCMICWVFCPDSAILVKDGRFVGFDLAYCKGCGICREECPTRCIDMLNEASCVIDTVGPEP